MGGFFVYSHVVYGHSGLPIGWDTPRYIGQMFSLSSKGVIQFIEENEYYNSGYGVFSSLLVIVGISPFVVEIFLPITLCMVVILMSGVFAIRFLRDKRIALYTMLLAGSWFTVYRLGADLHPNLLALVLLCAVAYFFLLNYEKPSTRMKIIWFSMLILASFVHIETTLFFGLILILSSLGFYKLTESSYSLRNMVVDSCLVLFVLGIGAALYVQHMRNLLSYSGAVLVSFAPLSFAQWIGYLGVLFPISFLGLYMMLRETISEGKIDSSVCAYNIFSSSWALASITLALSHYLLPAFFLFSDRALILFPTPFVASLGLKSILDRIRSSNPSIALTRRFRLSTSHIFLIFVMASSLVFTYTQAALSYKVWITRSAYEKLTYLSERDELDRPIFVFNDYDQYAGGLGNLYNDWVQAVYGDHYSYLGRLDFLLTLTETPFASATSQAISTMFLKKMQRDNVLNMEGILSHKVVIVTDFYLPRPLPLYDRELFDEFCEGVFVTNSTKLQRRESLFVPLYPNANQKIGEWYAIERNWTRSFYALEVWDPNPSSQSQCEIPISITNPGNYSFLLRYLDGGIGSTVVLKLNDIMLGEIHYRQAGEPANFTGDMEVRSAGVYAFGIFIEYHLGLYQYVSLDYLEFSLKRR